MGQSVSIHDLSVAEPPKTEVQNMQIAEQPESQEKPISRSNSCRSVSQNSYASTISSASMLSTVSNVTVSLSEKFISYDNTMIHIPPSSVSNSKGGNMRWKLRTFPKYNDNLMECYDDSTDLCVVFGICDAALLEKGYKHKYYGFGYSVTYCHNIKFQSFATTFTPTSDICIEYEPYKGELTFWSDGVMKQRRIRISPQIENIITVKCYNDSYDIRICSSC
eukprot:475920_1